MRKIAIIGAGQSGLQLGLGLLDAGYEVTLVSNRTGEDIRYGPIMSSQVMFDVALRTERDQGLNLWDEECPVMETLGLAGAGPDGEKVIDWSCALNDPCQSLDQRVKFPVWMERFVERGGNLVLQEATTEDAEAYRESHDLVVVAAGKGDLGKVFERDASRSPFSTPQRGLTLLFVKGMQPRHDGVKGALVLVPGLGEYLYFRALTTSGVCDIMLLEAVPGGPMDDWETPVTIEEHVEKAKEILRTFMPWEAERCDAIEATDPKALLKGRFPPTVRKPIGQLPSGAHVLGIGDSLVLNDPVTGRGANSAAIAASVYLRNIVQREDRPFDPDWMLDTFNEFWKWAEWGVRYTNVQLAAPPKAHIVQFLMAAQHSETLRKAFVEGLNEPETTFPWIEDAKAAEEFIAAATS